MDPDEWLTSSLKLYVKKVIKEEKADYFRIPRKNIIFGKWIRHTGWWPDYNVRLFKKGYVSFSEIIHAVPITTGVGLDFPAEKEYSLIHNNYSTVEEYISKMNRYTTVSAKLIKKDGYTFSWKDIIFKPTSEFLRRFFAEEGYKDGLHGLSLSLLQAFSELVIYLKLWQKGKFEKKKISLLVVTKNLNKAWSQFEWWEVNEKIKEEGFVKSIWLKIKRRRFQS